MSENILISTVKSGAYMRGTEREREAIVKRIILYYEDEDTALRAISRARRKSTNLLKSSALKNIAQKIKEIKELEKYEKIKSK